MAAHHLFDRNMYITYPNLELFGSTGPTSIRGEFFGDMLQGDSCDPYRPLELQEMGNRVSATVV